MTIEFHFKRPCCLERLRSGLLGIYIDQYAAQLHAIPRSSLPFYATSLASRHRVGIRCRHRCWLATSKTAPAVSAAWPTWD